MTRLDDWIEAEAARIAAEGADELAARRTVRAVIARYQELQTDPAAKARMDNDTAALEAAHTALTEGRAAFARGDLAAAEPQLRQAAGHELADSAVYLSALYKRRGLPELAAAWWTIAQAEGFSQGDLDEVNSRPGNQA